MTGRPGFSWGLPDGVDSRRDPEPGIDPDPPKGAHLLALVDPAEQGGLGGTPGFDPVWGTLGPLPAQENDPWLTRPGGVELEGTGVDVEVFCDGFRILGQLGTGQFDRLSDWLNMQSGFIPVQNANLMRLGDASRPDPEQSRSTQWVRLNGIIFVAGRAGLQQDRPGAPVVQKQSVRVSIATPGYRLSGSMHVHADGSMSEYLASPDSRFLAITDVIVRSLSDPELVARFPFALINREQLVAVVDES
ncbi:MAG: hypothetical protein ABSB75_03245 [Candidatus Limnocylindrales bacterium]